MAKKKPKSLAEIANIQVLAMKRLAPNAAAWLLGVSPRSLRDFVDLDRGANGSYDAQAIVDFAIRRGKRPNLADEQIEEFQIIVSELGFRAVEMIRTAFYQLSTLRDKHGDGVLLEFVELLLADWAEFVDTDKDSPDTAVEEALNNLAPGTIAAEHALRIAIVCPMCNRLRVGRTWRKKKPPKDYITLTAGSRCPRCEET